MNPKYHIAKRKYIYDILKSFLASIFITLYFITIFFEKEEQEITELTNTQALLTIAVFLVLLIAQLIIYWLILKRFMFSDQEESFLVEKGLFFKRRINLPYKNIHTISIKRRFKDIILGLSSLQIDTGTTASIIPEANIVLDKSYAPVLKQFIEKKKTDKDLILPSPLKFDNTVDESDAPIYQAKKIELMLMGILKPGFLLFIFIATLICFSIVIPLSILDPEINQSLVTIITIIVFVSLIVVSAIISMLYHLIKYYNYQMSYDQDSITYKYGLLSKVEFKLPLKRINAIHINQSLLYRLFNYYELNVSAIGIGEQNENGQIKLESKSLLPITRSQTIELFLRHTGYSELNEISSVKPTRYKLLNFILIPLIPLTILSVLPYIFLELLFIELLPILLLNLFSYGLLTLGLWLRLKQHQFKTANDLFVFQRGAYTLKRTLVKKIKIQAITYKKNPIHIIENIGHIKIKYKDLTGKVLMRNFEPESFENIKNSVIIN